MLQSASTIMPILYWKFSDKKKSVINSLLGELGKIVIQHWSLCLSNSSDLIQTMYLQNWIQVDAVQRAKKLVISKSKSLIDCRVNFYPCFCTFWKYSWPASRRGKKTIYENGNFC